MQNQISNNLAGLATAVQDGKAAVIAWNQNNLATLTQDDLLRGSGCGCPCGTCHGPQFGLFHKMFGIVGVEEFKVLLKEQFAQNPQSVSLPETAYILIGWITKQDIQYILKPFPKADPASGVNYLDTLSPAARERMKNHWVYVDAVKEMGAIVESLAHIGVTEKYLKAYQVHCHDRWLANYKPLIVQVRPENFGDTFDERFALFLDGPIKHMTSYYFLKEDMELLMERLLEPEYRDMINKVVALIPESKFNWIQWGQRLMTRYHSLMNDVSGGK